MFAVEQFFRNSDSVVTVQRLFRRKFNAVRRGAILDRNTIAYSDGLKHLEQTTHDRIAQTCHSSRNRSTAAKNVGACDAGLRGDAPNVFPAGRTSSD